MPFGPAFLNLTQTLLLGCGWFAILLGGSLGLAFAIATQSGVLAIDPEWSRQLFAHFMLGRLPTLLVACFVLLRVNFQFATDAELVQGLFERNKFGAYVLACILATMLAWSWFFLSVLVSSWLGFMHSFSGFGQIFWESYLVEFQFSQLLHAAFRMFVLSLSLCLVTLFEIKFLSTQPDQLHQMMSRTTIFGVLMILGIELLDFFWSLN
ncbi:hypothetical protein B9Z42_14975 [Limnohabitans sp. B9-3]|nr:hypothetical protein B9Z42_14975 [Limnohabitans sp. B9-3]